MEEGFLQNVLRFYGENSSLSTGNLENFLQLMTIRRAASVDDDRNPLKNTEVTFISLFLSRGFSHYNIRQMQLVTFSTTNSEKEYFSLTCLFERNCFYFSQHVFPRKTLNMHQYRHIYVTYLFETLV